MAQKGYFDVPPEAIEPPKKSLPHYALPNFSVVLPDYANNEADVIRSAFNTANFRSIADLPDTVKNGAVNRSRFEKMTINRQSPLEGTAAAAGDDTVLFGQQRRLPDKTNRAKYFMEFEYMPSPYSLAEELAKDERNANNVKVAQAGHALTFRPADSRTRHAHEDVAGKFTEYIIDPFECAGDQVLRQKWLMDAQVLAAPFKPAGRNRGAAGEASTEMTGRQQLPEIVAALSRVLEEDWEGCPMLVCATEDEHIVVRFGMATLEEEPGLIAYMNVFAASHELVSRHKLRKVVEDWNVTPGDGYLYFTFRPSWVHVPRLEAFYALHPEDKVYNDRRAAAAAAAKAAAADGDGDGDDDELDGDGGAEAQLGAEFELAARNAMI
ncbi:hypothetical protein KFE25_002618 [Diacronema lutheri]|uniref:Uncharacterized protein n=1 Tax=Diacronema lutheri TaxID=2081491 RepID=A0A8J5XB30_DIALT|nr:hypothetical protein KFE25_002618 [Diacronema lutheri]